MGIELGSNFDVKTGLPLDSRLKVADQAARDAILPGVRYEGMIVYSVADATNYQLIGGILNTNWGELSGSGGGSGGALQWEIDVNGPLPGFHYFQSTFDFSAGLAQELFMILPIGPKHAVGKQIRLLSDFVSVDTAPADVHFKAQTTLIRAPDKMTSTTNRHTSTNAAVVIGLATAEVPLKVDIDLTDADGKINGVAVANDDLLIVRLYRDVGDSSSIDAYFLPRTSKVVTA